MTAAAIVLIGFMGAGKSRIGMALAQRLRLPFVDTDALIVAQIGPIDRVFAEQGEPAFRAVERDVTVAALEQALGMAAVVSLGGGAVTSAAVRRALAALPHIVWLTAPPDVLFARAAAGGRPLAADEATFLRLLEQRRELYAALATVEVVNGNESPVDGVVEEVLERCAIRSEP